MRDKRHDAISSVTVIALKEFIYKTFSKKPKLKNPIMIEGLPGVGNVARVAVDFLISKLKAKKYMEIYNYYFPNSVFITNENLIQLPKAEVYYCKNGGRDIVFVIGDVQPGDEYASYVFSEKIIDIAQELGVTEIITLGGISSRGEDGTPKVYAACTEKKYIDPLKKTGVRFDRKGAIIIIGAAGLMLGLGQLRKINGFALLADTNAEPNVIGFNAAREIVKVIAKYLKLKIQAEKIDKEIKGMVGKMPQLSVKKKSKMIQQAGPDNLRYIG